MPKMVFRETSKQSTTTRSSNHETSSSAGGWTSLRIFSTASRSHLYGGFKIGYYIVFKIPTRHKNIDIVLIRENTEGEYSGLEHEAIPGIVESIKVLLKSNYI